MRTRIIAFVILVGIIGIPTGFYWYYTTKKTSSVVVSVGSGITFSLHMQGTFGVDNLPLADATLQYKHQCVDTCIISPVLPAKYAIKLTQTGKIDIEDSIIVTAGSRINKVYTFISDINFVPVVQEISSDTKTIEQIMVRAKDNDITNIVPIGFDNDGKLWCLRKSDELNQIGVLFEDKFVPYKTYSVDIVNAKMDLAKKVLLLDVGSKKTIALAKDLSSDIEISHPMNDILVVTFGDNTTKIRTKNSVYTVAGNKMVENMRFTDYIDLSPSIRIGYIDRIDASKLALSNFNTNTSVLIRLDRDNGTSKILRKGENIHAFIEHKGAPGFIDITGNIFTLQ